MSDFRKFCIGAFVISGLYAGAVNHGLLDIARGEALGTLPTVALLAGCIAVTIFGNRSGGAR